MVGVSIVKMTINSTGRAMASFTFLLLLPRMLTAAGDFRQVSGCDPWKL
jgi:hypothetical protein